LTFLVVYERNIDTIGSLGNIDTKIIV
jgi:hypothetical protein